MNFDWWISSLGIFLLNNLQILNHIYIWQMNFTWVWNEDWRTHKTGKMDLVTPIKVASRERRNISNSQWFYCMFNRLPSLALNKSSNLRINCEVNRQVPGGIPSQRDNNDAGLAKIDTKRYRTAWSTMVRWRHFAYSTLSHSQNQCCPIIIYRLCENLTPKKQTKTFGTKYKHFDWTK